MRHALIVLAARAIASRAVAVLAAPSVPATGNSPGPIWREVYPRDIFEPRDSAPVIVANEGVTVTITPPPPLPDGGASWEDAVIVVQFPGLAPYKAHQDESRESAFGISIGIGRMAEADPAATVLIAGYTGGMHCCATLQAVSLVDGEPGSVLLPRKDGELIDAFPDDIDGVRDIRWQDDSLLYAFTSYAASWPVPRIYHLRRGELVDVSRTPSFARIYHDFASETLSECQDRQGGENAGACAAYAHAMAIQGEADNGILTAAALATRPSGSPSQCAAEFDEELCSKRRAYAGFEKALRSTMRDHGYLP